MAGAQRDEVGLDRAELVFVGYGIQAPEYRWDDYKGMDLRGKVLVMLNNDPDWDPELFGGETRLYYGRWTYKYEIAAAQGAAGVILIHTDDSRGTRGRWCRPPGPASSSSCRTRASRASRSGAGSPRPRRAS